MYNLLPLQMWDRRWETARVGNRKRGARNTTARSWKGQDRNEAVDGRRKRRPRTRSATSSTQTRGTRTRPTEPRSRTENRKWGTISMEEDSMRRRGRRWVDCRDPSLPGTLERPGTRISPHSTTEVPRVEEARVGPQRWRSTGRTRPWPLILLDCPCSMGNRVWPTWRSTGAPQRPSCPPAAGQLRYRGDSDGRQEAPLPNPWPRRGQQWLPQATGRSEEEPSRWNGMTKGRRHRRFGLPPCHVYTTAFRPCLLPPGATEVGGLGLWRWIQARHWLIDWLTDWLCVWMTAWVSESVRERDWPISYVIRWLINSLKILDLTIGLL